MLQPSGEIAAIVRAILLNKALPAIVTYIVDLPAIAVTGCLAARNFVRCTQDGAPVRCLGELRNVGAFQDTQLLGTTALPNLNCGTA